jgi:hypothetical protein
MRAVRLLVFLAAAAIAVPVALGSPAGVVKSTPSGTLLAENAAFNAKNFETLYTAYTANYKSHCGPFPKWVKAITAVRNKTGTITTRDISVKIKGNVAALTYELVHNGKPLFAIPASSPDLYVKQSGLWYDEYEPKNGC